MLKPFRLAASLLMLGLLSSCANTRVDPGNVPSELISKPGMVLPLKQSVGIYLSQGALADSELFRSQIVQRGRYMREGVEAVARYFFEQVVMRDQPTGQPVSLMLDLDTRWSVETGKVKLDIAFRMFDAQGTLLFEGDRSEALPLAADAPDVVIKNVAIKTTQKVMAAIANSKAIDAPRSATTTVLAFPSQKLINEKSAFRIGTGAYIGSGGQVLTAASQIEGCLRIDIGAAGNRRSARPVAASPLLNLAVVTIDGSAEAVEPLSLVGARPLLGTATSAASIVRAKEGEPSRNLSFGNLTSHDGVAGSYGAFQFSSATRPQSFGSPLLDPDGKLVGVYSGGYPYDTLVRQGLLPANTFQATSSEVVAAFLKRSGVGYQTDDYATQLSPVERLGAAVVQVSCYQ